ncbi:MAG TPA: TylF/MycF family methyltransferase [Terriglobales bacterium]|nr:TylF/MycF family methyltransferase [Terriglobales bacterium]
METNANRTLYLDLMKRCLVNSIYGDVELTSICPRGFLKRKLFNLFAAKGIRLVRPRAVDLEARLSGRDHRVNAHTMIGLKRLDNLQQCIEDVIRKRIPGDLIETGVWRGGASIFMRAILKVHDVTDRCVWVADSFQGLPPPNPRQYPADKGDRHHLDDTLRIDVEEVRSNFEKYGLLDEQVRFLKGWFSETLPKAPIKHLAVIRLDGDMYESTMDAMMALYPKLSPGGYLIVDDYGYLPACRQAISDYRERNQIRDKIHTIDWSGVYWQRSA